MSEGGPRRSPRHALTSSDHKFVSPQRIDSGGGGNITNLVVKRTSNVEREPWGKEGGEEERWTNMKMQTNGRTSSWKGKGAEAK